MSPFVNVLFLILLYVLGLYVSLFGNVLPDIGKFLTLAFGLVISTIIYFSQFYSPLIKVREERKKFLIEVLMSALTREHRRAHQGNFDARINVMLVTRRYKIAGNPILRIGYTLGEFTKAELEHTYTPNLPCSFIALS